MPLYEYECDSCGVFTALRKMSESSLPAYCDCCGAESPRILSVPKLAIMDKMQRSAHERNEKSANEPRTARRSSCGCTGSHTCKTKPPVNQDTGKPGLQMQTKKTARPWMVGH
ncbi:MULTISPECIES: zinc ribbon domain-containing protein [unclassified Methylophilus]|jgi:putative FmdB family regulatory protein|uniref:Zinc ribbon domain-containing protein n=1 Tax=Methylophilus glucosoxydans TaxID=752553 RepID=A0ABW3GHH6_9PROT|nr:MULTISPECIES: zinc ribbon domain-containing protein [unclassified Methylophilus]MDF0377490.1 zinc ribbon domain-containing protein [Methylophilus sp. YYY-1]MDT7849562.1 zinc ribbon domain-containing protein [Methylophilus sp. VKM B-3414]BEV08769.1 zinc ribbon domain-containing protein [Methylophilus sp. DW102]